MVFLVSAVYLNQILCFTLSKLLMYFRKIEADRIASGRIISIIWKEVFDLTACFFYYSLVKVFSL